MTAEAYSSTMWHLFVIKILVELTAAWKRLVVFCLLV